MAENLDLDRVIRDPAYRRRVIARLNHASDDNVAQPETEDDHSTRKQAAPQPLD